MSADNGQGDEAGLHTSEGAKTTISGGPDAAPAAAPDGPDTARANAAEQLATCKAEVDAMEVTLRAATLANAAAFLKDVADGTIPFKPTEGNVPIRVSDYSYHLATHLAGVLKTNRKEVITLALCHYARALTSPHVTTLNDLAMLTKGMQFVVQDLTMEVAEFSKLALEIANQEAIAGNPSV